MPKVVSMVGLCDFRQPGVRKPKHRDILIDHLHSWMFQNGWEKITKGRLRKFKFKTLIGMTYAILSGQGSWLMDQLLIEYGYNPREQGLPLPPEGRERQTVLPLFPEASATIQPSRRGAHAS